MEHLTYHPDPAEPFGRESRATRTPQECAARTDGNGGRRRTRNLCTGAQAVRRLGSLQILRGALFVAVLMSLGIAAKPAQADPSCDAYVKEVLARQPSVKAGALRRDALVRESGAAGIWPDPTLTVMGDYLPGTASSAQMPMVRYQVSQMIMWPGKLPLMRDALKSESDAAAASVDGRKLDLALEARRAFFMYVMNAKRRELNRAARSLAATIASAALGRYASQAGGHHEVVRAELDVQALDVEHEALLGEQRSMLAMINSLRFSAPDASFTEPKAVTWTPPRTFTAESLTAAAEKTRPELREMAAMRDSMSKMASLARKEPYPDLMVGGWYNQMFMGAPNSFGVMVGGTIPVFGVRRSGLKAEAFDDRADAVNNDAAAMSNMIRTQVVDALIRFETAGKQITLLETSALPKARENFSTSLSGYSTGGVDIVGVLDSRRSLQAVELMLIEARVQRELALALLERAAGGVLPEAAP